MFRKMEQLLYAPSCCAREAAVRAGSVHTDGADVKLRLTLPFSFFSLVFSAFLASPRATLYCSKNGPTERRQKMGGRQGREEYGARWRGRGGVF